VWNRSWRNNVTQQSATQKQIGKIRFLAYASVDDARRWTRLTAANLNQANHKFAGILIVSDFESWLLKTLKRKYESGL